MPLLRRTFALGLPLSRFVRNLSTIFGLSSGHGKCGVAVIRISGPGTRQVLKNIVSTTDIKPRMATLKSLKHPKTQVTIDKGLVLWFPGPHSFTGEDSCEFQVHGGPAIIAAMMDALGSVDDCRPAEPGEFTKRAFFAGKLNLTEVEGLADLIHAETEVQRKQALYQASGAQTVLYKKWRQDILRSVAHLEAFIDFSEDENIEEGVLEGVMSSVLKILGEINLYLKDGRKGERLRNGVRTVILGEPNVGKSSFLNKICQRPVSIVTNIAGTTRDIIETNYNIAGYPILLADTAGLRLHTTDPIEAEGISRARSYTENAELLIVLVDAKEYVNYATSEPPSKKDYNLMEKLGLPELDDKKVLFVLNKSDLLTKRELEICESTGMIVISCLDNFNFEKCVDTMAELLKDLCGNPTKESPVLSHARHRHHLEQCVSCLQDYKDYMSSDNTCQDLAIAAQKLRLAMRFIGKIMGEVCTEDVLDVIFKDFCIGK